MSDIDPGDLVVCVDASPCRCGRGKLTARTTYRVEWVWRDPGFWGCDGIGLATVPHPHDTGFRSTRFRRLNDEAADQQLIAKIKACKPVRGKVSA